MRSCGIASGHGGGRFPLMGFSQGFVQAAGPHAVAKFSALVRTWGRVWKVPLLTSGIQVTLNPRLRSTVARYMRNKKTVEVGPRFFALPAQQADILAHEMAHAAVAVKYGRTAKIHGREWQALIRAVGHRPTSRLTPPFAQPKTARASRPPKYAHRCPVCQMLRFSNRPVKQWRCRSCVEAGLPGTLEITRVTLDA